MGGWLYELGLLGSVGVGAWILLDVSRTARWRRRLVCVAVLAASLVLWAGGELMLRAASGAGEVILARRVLFLGVCALPVAWLWTAVEAALAPPRRRARALVALAALPALFAYSALYWDRAGWFIDWAAVPTRRGPLFAVHAVASWAFFASGLLILARARIRDAARDWLPASLVVAGGLLPLLANCVYVALRVPASDPTPVAAGFAALLFRALVVDRRWAPYDLPFTRGEVIEEMQAGVLVADRAEIVVDANRAAGALLGPGGLAGRTLAEVRDAVARLRPARELDLQEFPLRRGGEAVGRGVILTDRTEARRAERRAEVATRLEALGTLVSGFGRELAGPLESLSLQLARLEPLVAALPEAAERGAVPAELADLAADAPARWARSRDGLLRMQRVLERLALFAPGREASAPRPLDPGLAVRKAVALARFGKGGPLEVRLAEGVPRVLADETELLHLLLLLLLHAQEASQGEERVEVSLEADALGAVVRVRDCGPAPSDEELGRLFDPFHASARRDRGLGLSVAFELARHSGGRLEAERHPRGGVVVSLRLPPAEAS